VALVVGAVSADVVGCSEVTGVETEDSLVVVGSADVADIVEDSSVVEGASLVEVVTPVPTTCRLGMIPAGMESAPICEKPKKRENMMNESCGNMQSAASPNRAARIVPIKPRRRCQYFCRQALQVCTPRRC